MGGVVGLALIGGLIAFLLVRKKQSSEKPLYALAPQDPNMSYAPHINPVYVQTSMTPAHGFGRLYVCFQSLFILGVSSRFLFCKGSK